MHWLYTYQFKKYYKQTIINIFTINILLNKKYEIRGKFMIKKKDKFISKLMSVKVRCWEFLKLDILQHDPPPFRV